MKLAKNHLKGGLTVIQFLPILNVWDKEGKVYIP
jgi:hypothetical protein